MRCGIATSQGKTGAATSLFWDSTTWRDNYYADLLLTHDRELSAGRAAEKEFCRRELSRVAEEVARATSIVDLGCGTGRVTAAHAESFPRKRFVGIDLSAKQLQTFEQRLSERARSQVRLIRAPMSDSGLPSDEADLVLLCNHTFGAVLGAERTALTGELGRVLKENGRLIIAGFSNLHLAPECYSNWGMEIVDIDSTRRLVQLKHHYSWWEDSDSVAAELQSAGFRLSDVELLELGFIHLYERKPEA